MYDHNIAKFYRTQDMIEFSNTQAIEYTSKIKGYYDFIRMNIDKINNGEDPTKLLEQNSLYSMFQFLKF